jgi:hypothetical protein
LGKKLNAFIVTLWFAGLLIVFFFGLFHAFLPFYLDNVVLYDAFNPVFHKISIGLMGFGTIGYCVILVARMFTQLPKRLLMVTNIAGVILLLAYTFSISVETIPGQLVWRANVNALLAGLDGLTAFFLLTHLLYIFQHSWKHKQQEVS